MSNAKGIEQGKFLTGSTMNHVMVMTGTASIGLIAIFLVDVANLYYISKLGEQALAAAIGYASTIMFFTLSISIGLSIAASALAAKAIGQGKIEEARMKASASLIYSFIGLVFVSIFIYIFLDHMLDALGAVGKTKEIAKKFMHIIIPTMPIVTLGMCLSGILRAVGDAKRAMYITLIGGIITAILDPIFIFTFDMGVYGAAWVMWIARLSILLTGLYGTVIVHNMLGKPNLDCIKMAIIPFGLIAIPTIATQLATPFGNAYVMATIAEFGDSAVAGWTIVGRIIPVAFGVLFALSGAVGPIIGQNYGAENPGRVSATIKDSFIFVTLYTIAAWAVLALFGSQIAQIFNANGIAQEIVEYFCLILAGSFLFNGLLFVASAAFNNLGKAFYATLFNWGRATLGVIPFVYIGKTYGVIGAITGWALGAVIFGLWASYVCYRLGKKPPEQNSDNDGLPPLPASAHSPFSTGKASMS